MLSSTLFFTLAAAVFTASASPVEDWKTLVGWDGTVLDQYDIGTPETNSTDLEKRNIGGVYICTDINWGGKCGYSVYSLGVCINLGSDWSDQISSFGPDQCTECTAHELPHCGPEGSGDFWGFSYPGDATGGLGTNNPWNDRITSFQCFQSC